MDSKKNNVIILVILIILLVTIAIFVFIDIFSNDDVDNLIVNDNNIYNNIFSY